MQKYKAVLQKDISKKGQLKLIYVCKKCFKDKIKIELSINEVWTILNNSRLETDKYIINLKNG